jgi:hypothetical protein
MAVPNLTIQVSFDFSSGAQFGYPFTIGDEKYGVLGVSQLASNDVPIPIVDLTDSVRQITITRGRNVIRDQYEAGTAVIRVLDPDSNFNPQNVNSIYYPYLTPLRKIRVSASYDNGLRSYNAFLFSGYTTEYRYFYDQAEQMGYVDIYVADAFRLFQLSQVTAVSGATAGQDTGTRIGKILDAINFPTNMRTIATGNSNCIADPGDNRTALAALKNAEFSEQGALYCDGSGTIVFKNRNTVVSSIAATPTKFAQNTALSQPYKNLVFAFNDQLIINQSQMTRSGGTMQFAENTASAIKYFPHGYNQTDLVIDTDANALNIARTYVATRAETTIRVDAMTIDLYDPDVSPLAILPLDYFSNVEITNVQPDGSTIVKTLQVQGLNWNITPNSMQVTVTTLEPITDGFVIGSTERGIIGVSAMTY